MSRLKELRKAKGLSQQALADKAGTNIRLIQKYEAGTYDIGNMTLSTAKAIAEALEIEIEDLMEGRKMTRAQELAEKIKAAETWGETEEEIAEFCRLAGLEDEWSDADGETFESVIYKAAEILKVEI